MVSMRLRLQRVDFVESWQKGLMVVAPEVSGIKWRAPKSNVRDTSQRRNNLPPAVLR